MYENNLPFYERELKEKNSVALHLLSHKNYNGADVFIAENFEDKPELCNSVFIRKRFQMDKKKLVCCRKIIEKQAGPGEIFLWIEFPPQRLFKKKRRLNQISIFAKK